MDAVSNLIHMHHHSDRRFQNVENPPSEALEEKIVKKLL